MFAPRRRHVEGFVRHEKGKSARFFADWQLWTDFGQIEGAPIHMRREIAVQYVKSEKCAGSGAHSQRRRPNRSAGKYDVPETSHPKI